MKNSKLIPLVIATALLTSSCENMSSGENAAVFGGLAGAVTGGTLALAGVDPAITIPVAAGAAIVAGGAAYIISKQQANARQRQIALQNAREAEARLLAEQKALASSRKASSSQTAKKASKEMPRFLAVDTEKSSESPAGAKPVMLYDTQSQRLVGNDVYNLKTRPATGSVKKFDTMTAKYVGS